jgi:phage terminase large subunit-like protein
MTQTDLIEFADSNIKLNEKGRPWTLSRHQRIVLALMYARHYSLRLWSEPKKSGKTFLAAIIALWEAITNSDTEIICCANDEEQVLTRVFETCTKLIKYNREISTSATVMASQIKFTNGSVIRAVSSDYKGQAGGRQKLTIFDELWAYDSERATRLFEEMTPPVTEPGAYILVVSYAGFVGEGELLESIYKRGLKGRRLHKSLEVYNG